MKTKTKISLKNNPKKVTTISYIALICASALLAICKWYGDISGNIILPEILNSHITNFSISLILCLIIGYIGLLYGTRFRNIILLGLIIIIANFLCETLMAFMNTVDILDAVSGAIGVAFAIIYLFIAKKYGFIEL